MDVSDVAGSIQIRPIHCPLMLSGDKAFNVNLILFRSSFFAARIAAMSPSPITVGVQHFAFHKASQKSRSEVQVGHSAIGPKFRFDCCSCVIGRYGGWSWRFEAVYRAGGLPILRLT